MKYIKLIALLVALISSACSLFEEETGVELSASSGKLTIQNNMDVKIYYNVMDNENAPYIDWVPFADDNFSIKSGELKKINIVNIYTDKERVLTNGDKVVVYWWTDKYLETRNGLGLVVEKPISGEEHITL